jgi:hypothetical protein
MRVQAVIFGLKLAREVHLGAGNVAVDVHTPRKDDHPSHIEAGGIICHAPDNLAALDTDLPHLAVNAIGRVMDPAVDDA